MVSFCGNLGITTWVERVSDLPARVSKGGHFTCWKYVAESEFGNSVLLIMSGVAFEEPW